MSQNVLITIIIILVGLLIILGTSLIFCLIALRRSRKECAQATEDRTHYKTQLSMVEYHYRNYKEGMNGFTVLREIGDVIQNSDK